MYVQVKTVIVGSIICGDININLFDDTENISTYTNVWAAYGWISSNSWCNDSCYYS